ncbi:alpha/beta hydrolase family protein [Paraburkholderia sp.]|uniref:alpha/beta hydrolase family protein n=1 Tax=Paraburkholderia sp. TaxID=1926495 RepID=UPI003D6F3DBF
MIRRWNSGAAALLLVTMLAACGGHDDITASHTLPATPAPIPDMPAVPVPATPAQPAAPTPARPASPAEPVPKPVALSAARFLGTAPSVANGSYGASPGLSYDFGRLMVSSDATLVRGHALVYPARMQGWVQYPKSAPDGATHKYPVVVLLHGMHGAGVDSFRGYDYLGETLATNGYVVISIDANDVNAEQQGLKGDITSTARAQLVLATLDHFFDEQMIKTAYPDLAGKLDRDRIGIMGHSRGGEGVADVVAMNGHRRGISLQDVRTAATDSNANADLNDAAIRTLFADGYYQTLLWERIYATLSWVTEGNIKQAVAQALPAAKSVPIDMSLRDAAVATSGVADAALRIKLQEARVELAPGVEGSTPPPVYTFKGMFALAPTDLVNAKAQPNVPLATLLPSCDGDVWYYMGARLYDTNRFSSEDDPAPRYQIVVRGGDHNWFNTTWTYDTPVIPTPDVPTQDDSHEHNQNDLYCQIASKAVNQAGVRAPTSTPAESIRLTAADQRKLGIFVMDSFMRYFVGGEQQFAAYWSGASQVPKASCRAGKDTCDDDVLLTTQRPKGQRDRVTDFSQYWLSATANVIVNPPTKSTSLYTGFTSAVACESFYSAKILPLGNDCWSAIMPSSHSTSFLTIGDSGYGGGYDSTLLMSPADHMELEWNTAGASIRTNLAAANPAGLSAANDDTLTFRIANAQTEAQEVRVTLSDGLHPDVTVDASRYSDALYTQVPHRPASLPASDVTNRMLLNMVGIPLAAFQGIDPARLKTLTLTFPQASGTIAVTDVQFQNLNRRSAMVQ